MWDGIEKFLTTATLFTAVVAALYRFWLKQTTHERIHLKMVNALTTIKNVSWYENIQRSLDLVTAVLDKIYGDQDKNRSGYFGYFTSRAWQTSALIVSCYILVTPCLLVIYYYISSFLWPQFHGLTPEVKRNFADSVTILLALLLWCFIVFRAIRHYWDFRAEAGIHDGVIELVKSSVRTSFRSGLIIQTCFSLVGTFKLREDLFQSMLYYGFPIAAIALSSSLIIRSIWSYGVKAPIFFILVFLFSLPTFTTLKFPLALLGVANLPAIFDPTQIEPLHLLGMLPISYFILIATWSDWSIRFLLTVLVVDVMYIGTLLLASGVFSQQIDTSFILMEYWGFGGYIAFAGALWIYTPILANSLPDTLSISFTRFCIAEASKSKNLFIIALLLFVDLVLAGVCIVFSLIVFRIGALIFEASIKYLGILFGSEGMEGFLEIAAAVNKTLDFAYQYIINWASTLLNVEGNGGLEYLFSSNVGFSDIGDYRWPAVVIAGFALTGAIPTVFNACVLSASALTRLAGLLCISSALVLHDLLTEHDSSGNRIGNWRSIVLISAVVGLIIATIRLWAGDYRS